MIAPRWSRSMRDFAVACCLLAALSFASAPARAQNVQVQVGVPINLQFDFPLSFNLSDLAAEDPDLVVFTTTDPTVLTALHAFGLTSPVTMQALSTAFPTAVIVFNSITFGSAPNAQFFVAPACVMQTTTDCLLQIDYSGSPPAGLGVELDVLLDVPSVTITGTMLSPTILGVVQPVIAMAFSQSFFPFTFDIAKGADAIVFGAAPTITVGSTGTVSAMGGPSTSPVVFSSTTPATCSVSGSTVTGLAPGTCTIAANQAADANFVAAAQVTQSFSIGAFTGGHLGNISTRMDVLTGNNVLIAGFIIGGTASKTVAITATGPSLVPFGITNPLANPTLTLVRQSDHAVIATNDDWQTDVNAAQLMASGFAPTDPHEAGLVVTLAPGAYTAIVSGTAAGIGVSVVGVFEIDHPEVPLINISTRGLVQGGNNVMIAGLIVAGTGPQKLVVTATGPSLAPFGIANPLLNPTLTLVRQSDHAVLGTNDDWQTNANAADIVASGFAPTDPHESALLVTLDPGAYTAIVSGVGGTTGVSVVGVFTTP